MKALVYTGPGQRSWEDKAVPVIQDGGDAIVRITTATICGTDLHILKGDVPTVAPERPCTPMLAIRPPAPTIA